MTERRRMLLVTRNLPPLVGGMERLVHQAYRELKPDFDVRVVGPQGCDVYLEPGDCAAQIPVSPRIVFLRACLWESLKAARAFKPHIVLAGSGVPASAV